MPTRTFNHVGVSVTDIDSAMQWYRDVLRMIPLVGPTEMTTYEKDRQNYDPHLVTLIKTIFGPRLGKLKVCHMSSANGVGIELFQFINLLRSYVQTKLILNAGKQDIFILPD
ncbi:MAG: hypothetical protein M3251_05220 [Thermoproteota archaeon]|nr:hypothetical protein [Thermoproteota archaeon]MDQ3888656.1 hypothetical protein [Thermoproteota archaeon]